MGRLELPPEAAPAVDAGQGHLFRFWDELDDDGRATLLAEVAAIDFDLVDRLCREVFADRKPDLAPLVAVSADHPDTPDAIRVGENLLRDGRVAFYMVAGGQGTRLGFPGPKGCFRIGPASGKTLFQWHTEKVLAASRHYGQKIPLVIMVSDTNEAETRDYLDGEGWFGLEAETRLVRQRMLPAVDMDGKILLIEKGRIALSPNGHGGAIDALSDGGALDWLEARGVTTLSFFQVDNPLVNPADPPFLGFHSLRAAEMSSKAVLKRDPAERAGVIAMVDGRPGVIEYTEILDTDAARRDPDGQLTYRLASIAAHLFELPFLRRIRTTGLPWHVAEKTVHAIGVEGTPVAVPGRKFETFIFDTIPLAKGFVAWLADRAEEFSPLKNAEGDNSPATVARDIMERTRRWYEAAGLDAPTTPAELELGPLIAADREGFLRWIEEPPTS
jgi:UDP-N-acetylglucosamine/UDP-N-acetylgalactosamine diphosphorylase